MTYLLPSQGLRSLLHHCGCVTIKLRGVVVVAPVHMDRELEHYDPRDIVVGMVGLYTGLYSEIIDCLWRWAYGLVGAWWRPIGQNIRQGEREVSN